MIQGIAEDEYVSQYHEVGSRPVQKGETEELRTFGRHISEYAFGLHRPASATLCKPVCYPADTCFKHNYESVIPPLQTFPLSWMVRAPENNIDAGDVGAGGLVKIICDAVREGTAVAPTDKYIRSKALAEKIVVRMSLQSTPTYRLALDRMQGFYNPYNQEKYP
ncbi:hypothetical protein L915_21784, partial [Phytophthora nicotianae]